MLLNAAFREELKEMVVEQVLMCANNPSSALTELLTIRQRFSNAEFFISPGKDNIHFYLYFLILWSMFFISSNVFSVLLLLKMSWVCIDSG